MNLSDIRAQIDVLDAEILARLNARAQLARQVGACKAQSGGRYYVPGREEALLASLAERNHGPLPQAGLRAIYKEIISACTFEQKVLTIAYLGPEATYTQQAAIKHFGHSLPMRAMPTIPDVFTAVERGDVDFGVVPIENSTEGAVFHSMDMLIESDLKIIGQIYLPIEHCLLSHHGLDEITVVYSKDVALGQCRDWLRRTLPQAELVAAPSTAKAAQMAADTAGAAAIASELACELYKVPVAARGIQDCAENVTRFLVLGREGIAPTPGGHDRTSFVFFLKDEAGTLEKSLEPFGSRGISLCKIESRPSRKKLWEYYFFVDCLGHLEDPKIAEAFRELSERCPFVKWLGSYPNVQS